MSSWTAADLPSFLGKTVVVTGANSGLGLVTARELARVGGRVILACRNADKGAQAAATMTGDVEVRSLDLQDLASVREFADSVDALDVLVNNAGIMAVPYALTRDGFESQIGTNHLGHFALTNLLLPKITDRVVTVSSIMHWTGGDQPQGPQLEGAALFGVAGLRPVQAGEPAVHRRIAAPTGRRGFAAGGARRPPRVLGHQSAGTHRQPDRHPVLGAHQQAGRHHPEFGANPTLYAASRDLPGDSFIGPKFGARGPVGQVGCSPWPATAAPPRDCGGFPSSSPESNFRCRAPVDYPDAASRRGWSGHRYRRGIRRTERR